MKKIYIFIVFLPLALVDVLAQTNNQPNILICWDTSFSMKNRNLGKEFKFLDNFLATRDSNDVINLVTFNDQIIYEGSFQNSLEDKSDIKELLFNIANDGLTLYNSIQSYLEVSYDVVLFFTDGNAIVDELPKFSNSKKFILINSGLESNIDNFSMLMNNSNGYYVNLHDQNPEIVVERVSLNDKSYFIENLKRESSPKLTKSTFTKVYGETYYNEINLPGVLVSLEGTQNFTISDSLGKYSINAVEGDVILFSHQEMGTRKIRVKDKPIIDVNLNQKINDLDEVLLVARKEKINRTMTSTGYRDENSVGYSVATISGDDINAKDLSIGTSIQGKAAGVKVGSGNNPGQRSDVLNASDMSIRGLSFIGTSNQPMVVIDGTPMDGSELMNAYDSQRADYGFIDPESIKSITILKSLAATTKYGDKGANGVILITTKLGQGPATETSNTKSYDDTRRMLGIDNEYESRKLKNEEDVTTTYLNKLGEAKSIEEAYDLYLSIRNLHYKNPFFFIDTHDYFNQFSDKSYAKRMLGNIFELYNDDPIALRHLGFKLIEQRDYTFALSVFKRIKTLMPNSASTYLDIAAVNKYLGNNAEALKNYEFLLAPENSSKFQYKELKKIVINEIKNLYFFNNEVFTSKSYKPLYKINTVFDARIVLNWSDPDVYFEVDFVDPNNKFFKWQYSLENNAQRIEEDKIYGLSSEEFQLIDAAKGLWKLNLKYLGNGKVSNLPSFLEVKVYKNFGKNNQTMESKLIRVSQVGSEINMINIDLK